MYPFSTYSWTGFDECVNSFVASTIIEMEHFHQPLKFPALLLIQNHPLCKATTATALKSRP